MFFKKFTIFLTKKVSKNRKNSQKQAKIEKVMNFSFSLQEFFSFWWIHCLLTSIIPIHYTTYSQFFLLLIQIFILILTEYYSFDKVQQKIYYYYYVLGSFIHSFLSLSGLCCWEYVHISKENTWLGEIGR